MSRKNNNQRKEFGDYQTPINLCIEIMQVLKEEMQAPKTILEPTCGVGNFVLAALELYNNLNAPNTNDLRDFRIYAYDINKSYISKLERNLPSGSQKIITIEQRDFFEHDWKKELQNYKKPLLIVGNPPWVKSSTMSVLKGKNLPQKNNFKGQKGLAAITGSGDFDISEWIILHLTEALFDVPDKHIENNGLAMLCKESVARDVLKYLSKNTRRFFKTKIFRIDAKKHFNVSTSAALLLLCPKKTSSTKKEKSNELVIADVYQLSQPHNKIKTIGYAKGQLLSNPQFFQKWKYLMGKSKWSWRSGVKHDATKIMVLNRVNGSLKNGFGEDVEIESQYLYPLLKGSDLAKNSVSKTSRFVVIPQKKVGAETQILKKLGPQTWNYLMKYKKELNARGSSIYKNKPPFSIFGVGPYTFQPWKVAISGFHKELKFRLVAPIEEKPVIFDDTCYFLSFTEKQMAQKVFQGLASRKAQEFYRAFIFWNTKRPITKRILKKMKIEKLIK